MDTFFTKFPNMVYGDYICKDITRRVKLSQETRNSLSQYYLYEVKNGNRADTIADAYYNDPYVDWMLYITNNIVDPYHQWPLSENEFNATLLKKYGDYTTPFKKIAFYRNNWYDDDNQLSTSYYDNNLPNAYKKYYSPVYGVGTKIIAWKRREEDWVMSTNKIIKLECVNSELTVGELVDVKNGQAVRVGGGEVDLVTPTFIMIKHIDGQFDVGNVAYGETSKAASTITSVTVVQENFTEDEGVYWSPVYYYDVENEANEYRKQIQILDSAFLFDTSDAIRKKLRE